MQTTIILKNKSGYFLQCRKNVVKKPLKNNIFTTIFTA